MGHFKWWGHVHSVSSVNDTYAHMYVSICVSKRQDVHCPLIDVLSN